MATCTAFCVALSGLIGPAFSNVLLVIFTAGAVAWQASRKVKQIAKVAENASQQAIAADAKAQAATAQMVQLSASLRPFSIPSDPAQLIPGLYESPVPPKREEATQGQAPGLPKPAKIPIEFKGKSE